MSERIVVIGASAAGLRAAARAKRLRPQAEVVVLDREEVISYGACGLPYYLSGDIESLTSLRTTSWGTLRDSDFFRGAKGLDVRTSQAVVAIDREARELHLRAVATGAEETLSWDQLVIATGARPRSLPGIPAEHPRVSFFKTPADAQRWRGMLERGQLRSVALIGAGFIGVELAEAFTSMWGAEVDLIEALPQVLGQMLDPEMGALVQAHLVEQGVRVHTGCLCQGIEEREEGLAIQTSQGVIETQHLICAIGFGPVVELAAEAGLAIGPSGAIAVDEYLRTSDERIYAAGDCVEVRHRVSGRPAHIPLGSLANRQGRIVGDNLAGRERRFGPVAGSGAVKAFDLNIASSGLSQAACERLGIECAAVWGAFSDKAHYYPEDEVLSCKLVYAPADGHLLGLQVVGPGEAVKRVDVFGNLLHRGGMLEDLLDLEFCYTPPYAGALDPLFTLGCAALNQQSDGVRALAPNASAEGFQLVDVRTASESQERPYMGREGVLEIPIEELRARLGEIPRDKPILIFCARGARSAEAARILSQNGFADVVYLAGGAKMRS